MEKCLKCHNKIKPNTGFSIPSLNGFFHAECFSCLVCKVVFSDEVPFVPVPHLKGALCDTHYADLFCQGCHEPLSNSTEATTVTVSHAFGNSYHTKCLLCVVCRQPIVGEHIEHHGKVFCRADYERVMAASCHRCLQPVRTKGIHANGKVYCIECFSCKSCNAEFVDRVFYSHKSDVYCLNCFHSVNGSYCAACNSVIEGKCISAGPVKYHTQCFSAATNAPKIPVVAIPPVRVRITTPQVVSAVQAAGPKAQAGLPTPQIKKLPVNRSKQLPPIPPSSP